MVQARGDSGVWSIPRAVMEGLACWTLRELELSGLALEHPSLLAPITTADASGLCPCAVPGANNTREEAVCWVLSPLQGMMLSLLASSHSRLLPPAGMCPGLLPPLRCTMLAPVPLCLLPFPVPSPISLPVPFQLSSPCGFA